MIPLNNYINSKLKSPFIIDGHIHLFSDNWVISEDQLIKDINVGFFDIEPKKLRLYNDIPALYDKFIRRDYRNQDILLAASVDEDDMLKTFRNHSDIIKGFGEIKAYNDVSINDVPLSELHQYDRLKETARENMLPVYIHYNIYTEKDARIFEDWIQDAGNIVLCHYGMSDPKDINFYGDNERSYYIVRDMLNRNENLYSEVTWASLNFFYDNPDKLIGACNKKLIIGSDLNRAYFKFHNNSTELERRLQVVSTYLESDKVIEKIFNPNERFKRISQ